MRQHVRHGRWFALCVVGLILAPARGEEPIGGEILGPDAIGIGVVESWSDSLARDREAPASSRQAEARDHRPGRWMVPSIRATYYPHSGRHNAVNQWGDPRMGIGFPEPVDVWGAFLSGQGGRGSWTSGVRVTGYRNGEVVRSTDWFRDIGQHAKWFAIDLRGVDRIVFECEPVFEGAGWYAIDDLTYVPAAPAEDTATGEGEPDEPAAGSEPVVVDFEDLGYGAELTGSGYAGLTWETGAGEYKSDGIVHHPAAPIELEVGESAPSSEGGLRAGGTAPELVFDFAGVKRGDANQWSAPPDTIGAIGPNHYVETVNRVFAVYNRTSGQLLSAQNLSSFLPGSSGDPRVLYDHHSQRFVVVVSDFSSRIYIAFSLSSNPLSSWYKSSFTMQQSGWPDYETLGIDANGIYSSSYIVGTGSMTIFAIDKAPLLENPPALGTITAFKNLAWEGAIQPAHTYGDPGGEFLIAAPGGASLRLYRVNPPLTSPTLNNWFVTVPSYANPPDAPALGSSTALDTVGHRPMMSVYRDGSLWTTHCIGYNGRAAVRWYQIDPFSRTLIQSGTVSDSSLYYFFPSIMVNARGQVALGFSGANANQYASVYFTGRLPSDPAGTTGDPVLYKAGMAPHNIIDGYGRNRWGDYSYTTLDPLDDLTFWTIQEYGHATDIWGTWIGVLSYGDCNNNGVDDLEDIASGTSQDCNGDSFPDECQLRDQDCNENIVPDACDIGSGFSEDCNADFAPDECQLAGNDCNGNASPDDCDVADLIAVDPPDPEVCVAGTTEFSVQVSPQAGDPQYQWQKLVAGQWQDLVNSNGHLSGTTSAAMVLSDAQYPDDGGEYRCQVTDGCIAATSESASPLFVFPPSVTTQPSNTGVCEQSNTGFQAAFGGTNVAYQWERSVNETGPWEALPGKTSGALVLIGVTDGDEGYYRCRGDNLCGQDFTNPALLVVYPNPEIVQDPVDTCAEVGGRAVFKVSALTALGQPYDFDYQWYHGAAIPGAVDPALVIDDVSLADAGDYYVKVSSDPNCRDFSVLVSLQVGGCPPCVTPGDLDGDADVDLADFASLQQCTGQPATGDCQCADLNTDTTVTAADFPLWSAEFTTGGPL